MISCNDPSSAKIAVSIVNYGTAELLIAALPALLRELDGQAEGVVIIVDNASPGDDADRLRAWIVEQKLQARVHLIHSVCNRGFAAGNNLAIAACRELETPPDAVLLLNPDAEIRPGALREMLMVLAARSEAGVVGPRLENPDGTSWVAAFHFPSALSEFAGATGIGTLIRLWPLLAEDSGTPVQVDWVSGAAFLVRWSMFDTIDAMDEGYFLYFEEVDFMRRASDAGWQIWHAPAAQFRHTAGGATGMLDGQPRAGRMPDYWFRSWRRYFAKNHGIPYARAAAVMKLLGLSLGMVQRYLRGIRDDTAPGFWIDFLRKGLLGGMHPLPEGREE